MGMHNRDAYKKFKIGDKVKPKTITCEDHGNPVKCSCPTKQEYAEETNINNIVARYHRTGQLPQGVAAHELVFADVSNIGSFGETLERIRAAETAFASLPADLRSRFANDPVNLVQFVQDDRNYDEAVKLGLIPKKETPAPAPAPTPAAPPAEPPKA